MATDKVYIQIITDDKGTTKKVGVNAKKLGLELENVGVSARDSERALKGAARTSSNSTKNFAKMAQGISGGLVPAYAAFAANIFALSAAFEFLKRAANLENLRKGQEDFAASTGVALTAMTQRLKSASDGMLGFEAAAKAAAMGVAKGFTSGQMEKLASGARKVSTALGVDFEDAFDRLVRGVSKAEPELLDELGITLRLETANKKYAASIGKSADALTAAERSQATYVETLSQLNNQFGDVKPATNAFVVLGKTFQKVAQDITAKLLPALQGLATFLTNNADAALTAFAALGAMILSSMTGFGAGIKTILGGVASGIGKVGGIMSTKLGSVTDSAIANLDKITAKLDQIEKEIADTRQSAASAADKVLKMQPKSKILKKVAEGKELSGLDKKNLQKAMDAAERQYKDHGKVIKGIFEDVTEDVYLDFKRKFNKIDDKVLTKFDKAVKLSATGAKVAFQGVGFAARTIVGGVNLATQGVSKFGAAFSKGFFWLGIISALANTFKDLISAPDSAAKAVVNMAVTIVQFLEFIIDSAIRGINFLLSKIGGSGNTIEFRAGTGYGDDGTQGIASQYVESFGTAAIDTLTGTTEEQRKNMEATNIAAAKLAEVERQRKEQFVAIGKSVQDITKNVTSGGFVEGMARANAFSSLGLSGAIKGIQEEKDAGLRKALTEDLRKKLLDGGLAKLGKGFEDAVITALIFGRNDDLKKLEGAGASYGGVIGGLKDQVTNFQSAVSGGDLVGAKFFIEDMLNSADAADKFAKTLNGTSEAGEIIQDIFGDEGGPKAFLKTIQKSEAEFQAIEQARLNINIAATKDAQLTTLQAAKAQRLRAIEDARLKVRQTEAEIQATVDARAVNMDKKEKDANKKKEKSLRRQLALQEAQIDAAETAADRATQMALDINNALEQSLTTEIGDILKGKRKSLKDAMKAIAKSAIDSLINNLAKNLVENLDIFGTGPAAKISSAMATAGVTAGVEIAAAMTAAGAKIATMIGGGTLLAGAGKSDPKAEQGKLSKFFEMMGEKLGKGFQLITGGFGGPNDPSPGASQTSTFTMGSTHPDISGMFSVIGKKMFTYRDPVASNIKQGFGDIKATLKSSDGMLTKLKDIALSILSFLPRLLKDLGNLFLKGIGKISPGAATGIGDFFGNLISFIPGFGSGGIHSMGRRMGYSTGGIAKGARSGYPAMLHGTEAIVPLPNGKSIPVHMQGGAGNISNITVNVASDGSTNVSGTAAGDSQQQMDIGRAIAQAVKEELHRQRRSGGILSRYGAAGGI